MSEIGIKTRSCTDPQTERFPLKATPLLVRALMDMSFNLRAVSIASLEVGVYLFIKSFCWLWKQGLKNLDSSKRKLRRGTTNKETMQNDMFGVFATPMHVCVCVCVVLYRPRQQISAIIQIFSLMFSWVRKGRTTFQVKGRPHRATRQ